MSMLCAYRIVAMHKIQLQGDTDLSRLPALVRRESLFLHIGGNLGFTLLLLFILFVLFRGVLLYLSCVGDWDDVPLLGGFSRWQVLSALALGSIPLLVGHYGHALAIRLLLEAKGVQNVAVH